ncbi:MAG: hypothetical protein ACLT1K_03050 [[Clostridium] leptum]
MCGGKGPESAGANFLENYRREELKARSVLPRGWTHLEGILFKAKASRMIDPSELETEEENEE